MLHFEFLTFIKLTAKAYEKISIEKPVCIINNP